MDERTTNGSYIGAGGADRRSFDRNPHFMLDWELLIQITTAAVLHRLRGTMLADRGILPYMGRTIGQHWRTGYMQNRGVMSTGQVK